MVSRNRAYLLRLDLYLMQTDPVQPLRDQVRNYRREMQVIYT